MHELMQIQRELDEARERCWDAMRQARIDNDPMAYAAAKYRKEGVMEALEIVRRAVHRHLDEIAQQAAA